MTNRERFKAALSFKETDRVCHVEHGFWTETYERWQNEGLPANVAYPSFEYFTDKLDLFGYTDVIKFGYMLSEQYFSPRFKIDVIEEDDQFRIERNEKGVLQKVSKTVRTIPMYMDYPIKCSKDYQEHRERLLVRNLNERYPKNWNALAKNMREQDHTMVCTHMDGFFAAPRELMGVDELLYMVYDDPDLIHQIIDDRLEFYMDVYEKAIKDTKPDFAFIWEDMSYKNGPLMSPAMCKEFLMPAYKKLTSYLKDMGVNIIIIDSDGDVTKLIPLWLDAGITCALPFEVRAGMDVVKIAEEFPRLQIIGGIDKHVIAQGKKAIDEELNRVLPYMAKRGGYCVSLDHWVPPDISLEDFRYYVERVREFKIKT